MAEARDWREEMLEVAPSGVVFFSPAHGFLGTSVMNFPAVERANRHIIHTADGLIANLSGPGRAFGTIREIEFARCVGTPVAVIGKLDSLMTVDLDVRPDPEAALHALIERIHEDRQPPDIIRQLFRMGE